MIKCYNDAVMRPLFSVMTKILSYIESQMDETSFDSKNFKGDYFGISNNKFARIIAALADAGYISGMEVIDYGEPDSFEYTKKYERFSIKLDNPCITIDGIRFMAENRTLSKILQAAKTVKDLIP